MLIPSYGAQIRHPVSRGEKEKAAEALLHLETNGHELAEIDDDLPRDLSIEFVTCGDAEALSNMYDDRVSYLDTFFEMNAVSNVCTRSYIAEVDVKPAHETVSEACSKELASLNTQDIKRA